MRRPPRPSCRTTSMRSLLVALVMLGALAGTTAWFIANERVYEPYKGYDALEQRGEIPPGTPTADIGRLLVRGGVVRDEISFRLALWWTGRSRRLQAGEYHFDHPLSPVDVVDQLARGEVYARRITFPEGLTIPEMGAILESRGV